LGAVLGQLCDLSRGGLPAADAHLWFCQSQLGEALSCSFSGFCVKATRISRFLHVIVMLKLGTDTMTSPRTQ
jgi:hypothetical protein